MSAAGGGVGSKGREGEGRSKNLSVLRRGTLLSHRRNGNLGERKIPGHPSRKIDLYGIRQN